MSWKEKIDIPFRIQTGDGITYSPLLAQANTMSIDLLATSFEFSGIDGSLVKRKASAGRTFPLVFYFTGENHLDNADDFIESAKNKKPWTVEHPKYGDIYCQPITINRDDSQLNRTVFSVEVRETINQSYPNSSNSKSDTINTYASDTNTAAIEAFGLALSTVETSDKLTYKDSLTATYEQYQQVLTSSEDSSMLENLYQKALTGVDNLNMTAVQTFIQAPKDFSLSVASKITQLRSAYEQITDLTSLSLKEYFQTVGASIISAICLAAINPGDDDYSKRKDVISVIDEINDIYSDYISQLDDAQDENLSVSDVFNADPDLVSALDTLVKETTANLNDVVFGALVENTYTVPAPTNIILLTHYLLGGVTEETIAELLAANDFTRDELVQIRKGREVIYYA